MNRLKITVGEVGSHLQCYGDIQGREESNKVYNDRNRDVMYVIRFMHGSH